MFIINKKNVLFSNETFLMLHSLICLIKHKALLNLEIYKRKRNSPLDHFLGTFFWVSIVLDCYHFGSGGDNLMCYFAY